MKQSLLISFLYLLTLSLSAQSLSFEYVDTDGTIVFENTGSAGQDVVIKGTLTNETNEDIDLSWRRDVEYIFSEGSETWESAVCDLNRCYLPFVSQADFVLPANGESNLDAHLYPGGLEGDSALMMIHLVDNNSGDTLLSVNYRFYEDISLSAERPLSELQTLVFPNPAASYFRVKSDEMISSIEVFDLLGKPVAEKRTQSSDVTINISHLHRGMYIVRITGQDGRIIKTQRLRKDML